MHICKVKNLQLENDLPTSVNGREIHHFRKFQENKTHTKFSKFKVSALQQPFGKK